MTNLGRIFAANNSYGFPRLVPESARYSVVLTLYYYYSNTILLLTVLRGTKNFDEAPTLTTSSPHYTARRTIWHSVNLVVAAALVDVEAVVEEAQREVEARPVGKALARHRYR